MELPKFIVIEMKNEVYNELKKKQKTLGVECFRAKNSDEISELKPNGFQLAIIDADVDGSEKISLDLKQSYKVHRVFFLSSENSLGTPLGADLVLFRPLSVQKIAEIISDAFKRNFETESRFTITIRVISRIFGVAPVLFTKNLSSSGMFLEMEYPIMTPARLSLSVLLDGKSFAVDAKVRWATFEPEMKGIGLQFLKTQSGFERALEEILSSSEKGRE